MIRRQFVKDVALFSLAGFAGTSSFHFRKYLYKDVIIGHDTHRYKVDMNWGSLDANQYPVNDCHEMVQDSQGRIVLLTNHTKNNVIIYNKKGQLEEVWGTEFPGAHGLTLHVEGGKDMLYIADNNRHEIIKTTIDGKVVQVFSAPLDSEFYVSADQYIPTETAIAKNGDVYVADGYGQQYIIHYNANGELLNVFGGRGEGDQYFDNAHGICVDSRKGKETLLITARMQNRLKNFSMDGQYVSSVDLPGAFICRPVIHKDHVFLATIWSGDRRANTGFVSILDKDNRMISAPAGNKPIYLNGQLQKMYQTMKIFQHPHDVCVDDDENLYVAQWNAGKTYPIKLKRV